MGSDPGPARGLRAKVAGGGPSRPVRLKAPEALFFNSRHGPFPVSFCSWSGIANTSDTDRWFLRTRGPHIMHCSSAHLNPPWTPLLSISMVSTIIQTTAIPQRAAVRVFPVPRGSTFHSKAREIFPAHKSGHFIPIFKPSGFSLLSRQRPNLNHAL